MSQQQEGQANTANSELVEGINQTIGLLQFTSLGLESKGKDGWASDVDEGIATLRVCAEALNTKGITISREMIKRIVAELEFHGGSTGLVVELAELANKVASNENTIFVRS